MKKVQTEQSLRVYGIIFDAVKENYDRIPGKTYPYHKYSLLTSVGQHPENIRTDRLMKVPLPYFEEATYVTCTRRLPAGSLAESQEGEKDLHSTSQKDWSRSNPEKAESCKKEILGSLIDSALFQRCYVRLSDRNGKITSFSLKQRMYSVFHDMIQDRRVKKLVSKLPYDLLVKLRKKKGELFA